MKLKVDAEKLRELLEILYTVANVRIVIFDDEFNKITAYPEQSCDFCTLIKNNPKSKKLCKLNDQTACSECKITNKLSIYKCHAGLFEAVAPIKLNDITLGYIMLGQVLESGTNTEGIKHYALSFTENQQELIAAIKKLPQKNILQIESLAKLMEISTCYLEIKKLIQIDEDNLIFHLSNYINDNITNDLSVESIMNRFHISRCRLYEISHKYFSMSIAKYIRHKRVMIAAELLSKKDSRIYEVAEKAGFTDYNYFSKIFKSEMGVTPTQYKKLQQHNI
ncbi:MAG: helix-turn-helix domain-containing protein [Ruminococcaceae bacterium]|nr:helix-turn-helix domain-containing protein [Oscillospiraceae bacterium]